MGAPPSSIPQIAPTVGVPDSPPRYARTAPQIPSPQGEAIARAGRGLGELTSNLGGILAVQQRHQQILDADTAEEGYKSQMAGVVAQSKQLQGNQQAPFVAEQSNKIAQQMLDDPNNSHIAGYLGTRLPAIGGIFRAQAMEAGIAQTAREHDDQFQQIGKNLAAQAAPDFQVGTANLARNAQFAKPGPYQTQLSPAETAKFNTWVVANKVNFDPNEQNADYDMRGYWKDIASKGDNQTAVNSVDGQIHFPDTYKTPYGASFSAESKYATPDNPFKWSGENLVDQRSGQTVYATGQPGGEDAGKQPAIVDGPGAIAARQKMASLAGAFWGNNEFQRNRQMQLFDDSLTMQRAQAIARNPDAAHPDLLNTYLNQNAGKFTPEHESQLLSAQTTAVSAPIRQMEANLSATRASSLSYQDQYIAQNGHPDMARLDSDAQFHRIDATDYQRYTGRNYEMQTPPATLDAYNKQIAQAPDPDELNQIKANIHQAAANKLISGADVPVLENKIDEGAKYFKTEAGQETKQGMDQIRRAYQGFGMKGSVYDIQAQTGGKPTIAQLHENALADFWAATSGVTDRAKIHDAWTKAIKDNQPDFGPMKDTPVSAPPPMPDSAKIDLGRRLGLIH